MNRLTRAVGARCRDQAAIREAHHDVRSRRATVLIGSPLPDAVARRRMFELNIGATPCSLTPDDLRELAEATEGYSGSDLSVRQPDPRQL